jgi:hypothetical protein
MTSIHEELVREIVRDRHRSSRTRQPRLPRRRRLAPSQRPAGEL